MNKNLLPLLCLLLAVEMAACSAAEASLFDLMATPAPQVTEAPTPIPVKNDWDFSQLLATPSPAPTAIAVPTPEITAAPTPRPTAQPTPEPAVATAEPAAPIANVVETSGLLGLLATVAPTPVPTLRPKPVPHPGEVYMAPSYGMMTTLLPDQESVEEDGKTVLVYRSVSEESFYQFGTYLNEMGYSVAGQETEERVMSLWLKKGNIEFDLVYDFDAQTLTLIYPQETDYEHPAITPTPTPAPTPVPTKVPDDYCAYCGGTRLCDKCSGSGECDYCFGEGSDYCSRCSGTGDCPSCYGVERFHFDSKGKKVVEKCYTCNNSGICPTCKGNRTVKCGYCNGSGECSYCDGTGVCPYCKGR